MEKIISIEALEMCARRSAVKIMNYSLGNIRIACHALLYCLHDIVTNIQHGMTQKELKAINNKSYRHGVVIRIFPRGQDSDTRR